MLVKGMGFCNYLLVRISRFVPAMRDWGAKLRRGNDGTPVALDAVKFQPSHPTVRRSC